MKEHNYFDIISKTNAVKILEADFKADKVNHAYMIVAQDSQTANMFARFFAFKILCKTNTPDLTCSSCIKALSGSNADFKIYPQKSKSIVVEDIQNIIENSVVAGIEGDKKVFLLNNFETANTSAQNKLLKTLEEPPKNTHIILCVSNISNVLQTIISRCKIINADTFSKQEINQMLINNNVETNKAQLITEFCNFNIGTALNYANNKNFESVLNCVYNMFINCTKSSEILKTVNGILKLKEDILLFLTLCEVVVHKALMHKNNNQNTISEITQIAQNFTNLSLTAITKHITQAKQKMQFNCNTTSIIDMLVLKILEEKHKWK